MYERQKQRTLNDLLDPTQISKVEQRIKHFGELCEICQLLVKLQYEAEIRLFRTLKVLIEILETFCVHLPKEYYHKIKGKNYYFRPIK